MQVVNLDSGVGNVHLGNMVVANLAQDSNIFSLHTYNDLDTAVQRVKEGKGMETTIRSFKAILTYLFPEWGVLYIPTNFTLDMGSKFFNPNDPNIQYPF
jgi:hypothetical protein